MRQIVYSEREQKKGETEEYERALRRREHFSYYKVSKRGVKKDDIEWTIQCLTKRLLYLRSLVQAGECEFETMESIARRLHNTKLKLHHFKQIGLI